MEFNLVHYKDFTRKSDKPFDVFISYISTQFDKYIYRRIVDNNHFESIIVFPDNKSAIYGEDPRVFKLGNEQYLLSQEYIPSTNTFKQHVANTDTKEVLEYGVNKENFVYGKNWTPFVFNDKLYIIHKFDPITIIKDGEIIHEHKTNLPTNIDNVKTFCMYRGGTNGLQKGHLIFGFGHANESMQKHTPFLWVIDTKKNTYEHAIITDFPCKYKIVDSTSLFEENGKYYLGVYESEIHWIHDGEYECFSKVYEFNFEQIYSKLSSYADYKKYENVPLV